MDLDGLTAEVDALLVDADEAYARQYPGAGSERGPIQTLYVAAGDFHGDYVRESGREASSCSSSTPRSSSASSVVTTH